VASDPHKTIFGEWACGPAGLSAFSEPAVGCLVVQMHRVAQGEQHVHIKQIDDRFWRLMLPHHCGDVNASRAGRLKAYAAPIAAPD
jgi:uncharacterized protein (DUF305 family)